eukprot:7593404-Pyramimonas_sp.AAC.1
MCQGRRHVHRVIPKASAVPNFCAEGSDALDGFLPVVLHMAGFSIIAIFFNAHPSVGFAGENLQRFAKLGALIQNVQLPWFIVWGFQHRHCRVSEIGILEANPRLSRRGQI